MPVAAIFELTTPYSEDELADIGYDQAADAMILAHLNHRQQKLVRYDHNNWTVGDLVVQANMPMVGGLAASAAIAVTTAPQYQPKTWAYTVTAINDETGVESLAAGSVGAFNDLSLHGNYNLITWSPVITATSYNIYKGDVASVGFIGRSTDASLTFRDDNVLPDYTNSYPRGRDPFAGDGNYPATVAFYQQRSIFGRTRNSPAAMFASRSADLFNFNSSVPVRADDAMTFSVAARRVNAVLHLVPLKSLIVFTTDSIFAVAGSNGGLAPDDINISPEGYRGASRVRPVAVDDVVFWNTARGNSLRTLNYQFERDGYKGNDITVFARHFFRGFELVDMAWAEEPAKTIWCVRSDGKLLALTWMEEQDVWGWTLCETDGLIESCCVVAEGTEDVLYVVVKRELAGGPVRHIERLMTTEWTDIKDAIYLDAARTYEGDPVTEISGLDYLEGRTVNALADGGAVMGLVVSGGKVTLKHPASKVTVGLAYEAWGKTLPIVEAPGVKNRSRDASKLYMTVERTRGVEAALGKPGKLGPNGPIDPVAASDEAGQFFSPRLRTLQTSLNDHPDLYSGVLELDMEAGDWTAAGTVVTFRQKYPLPMYVAAIDLGLEYGG